ncbi:MAG TPA: Hpt domain-containing protein, partial [Methylomirabilota bacterium]|nr:Hpt domain-containing protein [Methylomirabilota bacterium]
MADGDRQFLLSVFLMEAWDTLAAVEDGLAALRGSADSAGVVEHLAVVTHRLRGSAALSGFPQLAGLAAAMEEAVERTTVAGAGDRRSLAALGDLVFSLKAALDTIGETGVEDADAIVEALAALAPTASPAPTDETSRRLAELDQFFTDQSDVLEYFVPEAVEHLESMAQSLIALEGEGATESEIAALFRAVHTLKGAAFTVGCGMIGDLAHRLEDMLGEIREQRRALDRAAIETVFAGLDALRLLVRSGEERADTRATAYERALGLLDALPALEAAAVDAQPSVAPLAAQTADASESSLATTAPMVETPQRLEPAGAAER